MWDLPGPGLEPVSPAFAGGFLTTVPPRKPPRRMFGYESLLLPGSGKTVQVLWEGAAITRKLNSSHTLTSPSEKVISAIWASFFPLVIWAHAIFSEICHSIKRLCAAEVVHPLIHSSEYLLRTYHLYVESKIRYKSTYLWHKNRLTDIENRLVVAKGERGWRREGLGVWD